jgi:hypothetical protein
MAFAGPVDFTFSSTGTYNWTLFQSTYLNVVPGGGGSGTLDFNISTQQTLPTAPTQSLAAAGDSFYYCLFALPLGEGSGIGGTEVGTHTLTFTFGTSVTGTFSLAIPIEAFAGSGYDVWASSVSQTLHVSGDTYLTARILFDNGMHANTVDGHIDGAPDDLADTYNWTRATHGSVFYLQVTNQDIPSAVPEPATFFLLGSALVGLGMLRRRKRS